jgi:hypothetical protein
MGLEELRSVVKRLQEQLKVLQAQAAVWEREAHRLSKVLEEHAKEHAQTVERLFGVRK